MKTFDPETRDKFIAQLKKTVEKKRKKDLEDVVTKIAKAPFDIPKNFDQGLDDAIDALAAIQKLRDVITAVKTTTNGYRLEMRKLWDFGRNTLLLRDPEMANYGTQTLKDIYIKSILDVVYREYLRAESVYENVQTVLDNIIAKFNTCSRMIAVLEMKIQIGEIEDRRRK